MQFQMIMYLILKKSGHNEPPPTSGQNGRLPPKCW